MDNDVWIDWKKKQKGYEDQLERIDRLLVVMNAQDPFPLIGEMLFSDVVFWTIESMWHVKDWVLNDVFFESVKKALNDEIHAKRCLLICADLANGSKHLTLKGAHTSITLDENAGVHIDGKNDIYLYFYDLISDDAADPYHRMEIRPFLNECRRTWQEIVEKYTNMVWSSDYDQLVAEYQKDLKKQSGL